MIFNPLDGQTVMEPPSEGKGFWAGAPSPYFDHEKEKFYLYYRNRRPTEGKYGDKEAIVAESKDGVNFNKIWSSKRGGFSKCEGAAFLKRKGDYWLYISYHNRKSWRIDLIKSDNPVDFDWENRIKVLRPFSKQVSHVKDPVSLGENSNEMVVSYHPRNELSSYSGLIRSDDGMDFHWVGDCSPHTHKWNEGIARITSVIPSQGGKLVFFDCERSMQFSGEEKSSVAFTKDLNTFIQLKEEGPLFKSPHLSESLRYIKALEVKGKLYFFYEYAHASGAHELRVNKVSVESLKSVVAKFKKERYK